MIAALAVLVFVSAAVLDYAHTRYVAAATRGARHAAARWSVAAWCAASVGFVVTVEVTMWMLPAEAAGLYLGTYLGTRRPSPGVPST